MRARKTNRASPGTYSSRREWLLAHPEKMRGYNRKNRGIKNCPPTPDAGTPCQLCGKVPTNKVGELAVLHADHNHSTGEFRGWLCRHCNVGIGMAGDSVETLQAWIDYLRRPD